MSGSNLVRPILIHVYTSDLCPPVNASRPHSDNIPAGEAEAYDPAKIVQLVSYNAEKSQRILGIRYRTLEETSKDVIEDFKARGWL